MATSLASEAFISVSDLRLSGACPNCIDESVDDADVLVWIEQASDLIAIMTGMRVHGRQSLVARPCRTSYVYCDCCHLDAIPLGDPKPTVDQVFINGTLVPADEYDLHWGLNGWSLVRLGDGTDLSPPKWPSHQKLHWADTEDDTFAVYVTVGVAVDTPLVQAAVAELVCDFAANALQGYQDDNELNPGIIQAQIGNATVVVDRDRYDRIKSGQLGPNVTKMIAALAPEGRYTSAVYAPELHDGWRLNLRVPAVVAS